MKKNNLKSITLAAVTFAGISLLTTNADAQWRNSWGWSQQTSHGSSGCSVSHNTLRSDVYTIDRLASQMVYQFSREMNYRCGCSVELLNHLKKNAALTRNLVTALNGSCKCTFEKAACAVNDNMACVAKQSRKVRNLSCLMKGNISEGVTLARRIHKNADQFVPRGGYTSRRPAPAPAPVYVKPDRHDDHGHNHNTAQRDAFSSLLFSIFNR